jgi:hypothetical protein
MSIYKENGQIEAITTGCGCCSSTIHSRQEMMSELRHNLLILKDAANIFELKFDTLIQMLEDTEANYWNGDETDKLILNS